MKRTVKYTLIYAGLFYLVLILTSLVASQIFSTPSLAHIRERIRQQLSENLAKVMNSRWPWLEIYINNLKWAVLMTLPYLGLFIFFFVTMSTGIALGASMSTISITHRLIGIISLFLPHGILESIAYGLALYAAVNGRRLSYSLKTAVYVAFILFIAAVVEYAEILFLPKP